VLLGAGGTRRGVDGASRSAHGRQVRQNTPKPVSRTLVGRPAAPEELAPFLVYLASPESDYMTGQMYMVDGGQILV
jgi:meso-butanediol dehydrogenase / (S,S)-butanediol dehydrogenase / diacetyl reductase